MAEYRAEEILVIEPGSEFVTRYKPFKVKSKLCEALPGMLAGIRKIVIGKNIAVIGESAFAGCEELCEVEISDGVTEIGANAFENCANLVKAVIPKGVTEIGRGAFAGCANLTDMVIPASVKTIGENAFCGCDPDRANDLGLSYNDLTV